MVLGYLLITGKEVKLHIPMCTFLNQIKVDSRINVEEERGEGKAWGREEKTKSQAKPWDPYRKHN